MSHFQLKKKYLEDMKLKTSPIDFNFPCCIQQSNNGVKLIIQAKPGAKQSKVTDISTESIGIQIGAPPKDGKANEELVEFLAEVLNVKKRQVSLDKGVTDRSKIVIVSDTDSKYVYSKLKEAIGEQED